MNTTATHSRLTSPLEAVRLMLLAAAGVALCAALIQLGVEAWAAGVATVRDGSALIRAGELAGAGHAVGVVGLFILHELIAAIVFVAGGVGHLVAHGLHQIRGIVSQGSPVLRTGSSALKQWSSQAGYLSNHGTLFPSGGDLSQAIAAAGQ